MPVFLSTPRLRLRPCTAADAAFLVSLNADPEARRFTGEGALDLASARAIIDSVHHRQHPFGVARLVVERMGTPIGWCGLRRLEIGELPELGYRFLRRAWGQGFATEAAMAVLDHGFARADIHRVRAQADRRNLASVLLLERLGMHRLREWTDAEGPAVEYALRQDRWFAHRGAVLAKLARRR